MPTQAVAKFLLTEKTPVSIKRKMCCDAAHRHHPPTTRHICTARKGILLYEDASFSIVHATDPVAPPLVRLEPMGVTREILRNHLAANEQTGTEGTIESQEMASQSTNIPNFQTKEPQQAPSAAAQPGEGIAPTSTLPAKAKASETPGGAADTQGKDGVDGGLESEIGGGQDWVVLKEGEGEGWEMLEEEAEGEGDDGEDEEEFVDLACK
ncbi:hypothetical protein KC332_g10833 [Hortaea werneckii]|nr:hypothetical protein KC358_g11231 [Hortaea werneckii]KAI6816891.1 hypothetical protein KC350_g10685 [Hortaea werneckii]KAI6916548.1 hypothetical protein KC348_g11516 [Hortaea werneckii]KAI6930626.1 hypothetical protein KC341_g10094 [Hortaea werneckii]KAI6963419.1 hypothetical protein KC321_g11232 [Hortaea werneckii]